MVTPNVTENMASWICPECKKLLCGDGFTAIERKIEAHLEGHRNGEEKETKRSAQCDTQG